MNLNDANERILKLLSEAEGPITLGLLPVDEGEQEMIIELLVNESGGHSKRVISMLGSRFPAAVAYALAAAASQAVTQGGMFWPPFSQRLNVSFGNGNHREQLGTQFSIVCRKLGVIDPDVSAMAWANVAPLMAQASILHCWAEALAGGMRVTLKDQPLPDLEDWESLENFARALATHIHYQPNLSKILKTGIGGVVVNRLIRSCVFGQFEILPPHFRQPMKIAFEGKGGQVALKSPYVTFSIADGCFMLVLPKQPPRLLSELTHWEVAGCQYSVRSELMLSEHELGSGELGVKIRKLRSGYGDQSFAVNLGLSHQAFRVFDAATGRERRVLEGQETALVPAEYFVVLREDAWTDEEDAEEQIGNYRLLEGLDLRPGVSPLTIQAGDVTSSLAAALKAGLFHDADKGESIELEGGQRLHYGEGIHLLAYIPKNQHSGTVQVEIRSRDQLLLADNLAVNEESDGVYDYSAELEELMQRAVQKLAPGLHPLHVRMTTDITSVARGLWYWKGLERISKHLGFRCQTAPTNLDYSACRGIRKGKLGCDLDPSYHAPRLVLAVKDGERLNLLRPGVRAVCIEPTEGDTTELRPGEALMASEDDKRILLFESGGFETWSIECNGKKLVELSSKKTSFHVGLKSVIAQFGKAGIIEAVNPSVEKLRLVMFSSGLLAKRVTMELDHGRALVCWRTSVPCEDLGRLGLRVSDYSSQPDPEVGNVLVVYNEGEESEDAACEWELCEGVTVLTKHLSAEGSQPERVKIELEISPEKTASKLLLIDAVRAPIGTDDWLPLQCVDYSNPSRLSIVAMGGAPVDANESTWWHHLWRTSSADYDFNDAWRYHDLDEADIASALGQIGELTSIKYPSAVYGESAKYLSSLAHKLATRRAENCQRDTNAWWTEGALELERHAAAKITPVVRQFLFSCNPRCLRRHWSQVINRDAEGDGRVIPSLRLSLDIRGEGGREAYAAKYYHSERHPSELFCSFENFGLVSMGKASAFSKFDFQSFFKPIFARIERHEEAATPLDGAPLLSARHLLEAIHALNRRIRVLARAAAGDAEHPLQGALGCLVVVLQTTDNLITGLHQNIGYVPWVSAVDLDHPDHFETPDAPQLPGLESEQADRLNRLTWRFCVLARGTANGRISKEKFTQLYSHFSGGTVQKHPLNLILSFAPELFAYYVGLLDFALYSPPQDP